MPNPGTGMSRPELGVLVEDFDLAMDRQQFVGQKLFPRADVALASANAERIKIKSLLETRNTARRSDGGYNQGDFEWEPWHYDCIDNGIEIPVDARKRAILGSYFAAETIATILAQDVCLRNQERRIAAAAFNTTTFATTQTFTSGEPDVVAGANTHVAGKYKQVSSLQVKWTNYASCTPIYDVLLAKINIYANSGIWPDTVVLSRTLFTHLRQCAQIIDRVKYVKNPDDINESDIAAAFDIENVFVAGGSKNTADAKQAATIAQIWDSTVCGVYKRAQHQGNIWDPGIGRTFFWSGDGGEVIETYYSNEKRRDVVRMRHDTHENLMYSALGYNITGCS